MRRTIVVAAAVAALVAVVAAATGAGAKGGPGTVTLRLHAKLDRATGVDNTPAGKSAGDVLVFTEKLFDAQNKPAGSDAATCTALFDQRYLCTGAYILHGGKIMVQLVQPGPTETYDQTITGGSGKYARTTGTVTVHQLKSGDRFTFHIRRP